MPSIKKRGDSYLIKVSCGYDINGKQDRKFMTWKPDPNMTEKQIEKELNRQATLFEEKCRTGQFLSGNIKFADFAAIWMERYAIPQLREKTIARYNDLLIRINQGLGHIHLDNLQPQHLMAFYENLNQDHIRKDTKYVSKKKDFKAYLKTKGLNKTALAQKAGVCISVVDGITQGKNISPTSKDKICLALGEKSEDLFKPVNDKNGLSGKTIQHHHRLISSILSTAVQWQVIPSNPCQRIRAPKVQYKEVKYLEEDEAVRLMQLLEEAPIKYRCAIYLDLCTGLRRGELCGLEWSDFNFDNGLVDIQRSSLYLAKKGIFEDDTKTASSRRSMKLPESVISMLKTYKTWQNSQRLALGDKWQDSDRVFTTWDGTPIHPDTLTAWFSKFAAEHGFEGITLHSLRHTNASLQIASGVPIRTVSGRLGHAQTSTTTNIYAHAIRSADAAAAEALEDILNPKKKIR